MDLDPPKDEEELQRRLARINYLATLDEYQFMQEVWAGRKCSTGNPYPRNLKNLLHELAVILRHALGLTRPPPKLR